MNPGEYLVLTADDAEASARHLGFGLGAEGDGVYLYDATGELIDSVEFGSQVPDLSIGRVGPDGLWRSDGSDVGPSQRLATPRRSRRGPDQRMAGERKVLFESDFIELYNPDPLPVDLGEFYLTDTPSVDPGPASAQAPELHRGQGIRGPGGR